MRKQREKISGVPEADEYIKDDSDDDIYVPGERRSGRYFDVSHSPSPAHQIDSNNAAEDMGVTKKT